MMTKAEGSQGKPVANWFTASMYSYTFDTIISMHLPAGRDLLLPGENAESVTNALFSD